MIGNYLVKALDEDGDIETLYNGNHPDEALNKWIKNVQKKNGNVAILAKSQEDVNNLYDYINNNVQKFLRVCDANGLNHMKTWLYQSVLGELNLKRKTWNEYSIIKPFGALK